MSTTGEIIARLLVEEAERRVAERDRVMAELRSKDDAAALAATEIYLPVGPVIDTTDLPLIKEHHKILCSADDDLLRLYYAEQRAFVGESPAFPVIYSILQEVISEMVKQMGLPENEKVFLAQDHQGPIVLAQCVCPCCAHGDWGPDDDTGCLTPY